MPGYLIPEPAKAVLRTLSDALDLVDFAIVLLDPSMRLYFCNARVAELVSFPADLLAERPTFRQMLDYVASEDGYSLAGADLARYLDERAAEVRGGSIAPRVIEFTDGRHVLFRCTACPDGGRALTYVDITDQLRQEAADAVERSEADHRFNIEMIEGQASTLASLAETAEDNAQKAEAAKVLLEGEIAERRQLEVKLRHLATVDGLTGALNRAALMAVGQRETEIAGRAGTGLAVLMLDVDHFKAINDRYGHAGGDCALRHLVALLRAGVRQIDMVGRLGGEEFAVVLPGAPVEVAEQVAERLRRSIAGSVALFDETSISMTVSIGLATRRPADQSIEQIIARADDALYRAKSSGRNMVITDQRPAEID